MAGHHLLDHLGHPQMATLLEPLGQAHHRDPGTDAIRRLLQNGAEPGGGDPDHHQVGTAHRLGEIGGGGQLGGLILKPGR